MKALLSVLSAETLKLKRTNALRMVIVAPLAVIGLVTFLADNVTTLILNQRIELWLALTRITLIFWTSLMMPLYVTLETALVAGVDHAENHWKILLARPVPRWTYYAVKLFVVGVMTLLSMAILVCGIVAAGLILPKLQHDLLFAPVIPIRRIVQRASEVFGLAFLLLAIQHWVFAVAVFHSEREFRSPGDGLRVRNVVHGDTWIAGICDLLPMVVSDVGSRKSTSKYNAAFTAKCAAWNCGVSNRLLGIFEARRGLKGRDVMKWLKLIAIGTAVAVSTQSFSQKPEITRSTFEVASVKPSIPGMRESMSNPPGRFAANNLTLKQLIGIAYGVGSARLLEGGPSWIGTDQWTIEATFQDGTNSAEAASLRLQSLLEDRFQLKIHHETRDIPVYTLTVNKTGLKLTSTAPPPPPSSTPTAASRPPLGPRGELPQDFMPQPGGVMAGPGLMLASAVTMDQIADLLRRQVGRTVINQTGLQGYFNARLQFAPEGNTTATDGAADSRPSIFTAVQEQLGLKLESGKHTVDVLVVDGAEKPQAE